METKKDDSNAEMASNLTKWLSYVMCLKNKENENQLAMSNIQIILLKPITDENEKPLASIGALQIEVTLGTVFYSL